MRKLIFILILTLFYSVKAQPPIYKYVGVCGQEGMSNAEYFGMIGEQKYLSIIKDFENQFKKSKNNYSDYYRLYSIHGGIKPTDLFVSLIPKSIVTEENRKKKEYRVFGDERTLRLYYNLKTKKISKVYHSYILYDI